MIQKTLLAAAVLAGSAVAASAATLSIVGGSPQNFGTGNYDADCTGGVSKCYNPNGSAGVLNNDLLTFDSALTYPGLTVDSDARLTVTFMGKEAGATNAAFSLAGGSVSNTDADGAFYETVIGAGTVDFNFNSNVNGGTQAGSAGFSGGAALGFSQVFNSGRSVFAYFDDSGAANDRDYDDMVVRIDVAPVPVPAAGLLLIGGLGGFAALRRRKNG